MSSAAWAHLLVSAGEASAHHLAFQHTPLICGEELREILGQPCLALLVH